MRNRKRTRKGNTEFEEVENQKLPAVQSSPVAIAIADLHFCHTPPLIRRPEKDWYDRQAGYMKQLKQLSDTYSVPILCAGDVFDHWRSPPSLINLCMEHLPRMFAVPGQHDLPLHNYADIKRSAFWTLVESNKLTLLEYDKPRQYPGRTGPILLYGFPWGHDLHACPVKDFSRDMFRIAVVHRYIWMKDHCYNHAPQEFKVRKTKALLKGYHAAIFGDNHKGFIAKLRNTPIKGTGITPRVINCGAFMRRRSDELEWNPRVGVIMSDGVIKSVPLDVSADRYDSVVDIVSAAESGDLTLAEFIGTANSVMSTNSIDFVESVNQYLKVNRSLRKPVRRALLELIEWVTSKNDTKN